MLSVGWEESEGDIVQSILQVWKYTELIGFGWIKNNFFLWKGIGRCEEMKLLLKKTEKYN